MKNRGGGGGLKRERERGGGGLNDILPLKKKGGIIRGFTVSKELYWGATRHEIFEGVYFGKWSSNFC